MLRQFELFTQPNTYIQDKVTPIKAIRVITGLGLKEAKDMVDAAIEGKRMVFEEQGDQYRANPLAYNCDAEIENIRKVGFSVVEFATVNYEILEKVKNLTVEAIEADEFGVAMGLLEVLKASKERR